MALVEPLLGQIAGFSPTVAVHGTIETVYRVHINPPAAEWQPHGSFAVIKITGSGSAETDSILPSVTFDVEQDLVLSFDAGAESRWLSPGSRTVSSHATGIASGAISRPVSPSRAVPAGQSGGTTSRDRRHRQRLSHHSRRPGRPGQR
jgi:hypothetical protein